MSSRSRLRSSRGPGLRGLAHRYVSHQSRRRSRVSRTQRVAETTTRASLAIAQSSPETDAEPIGRNTTMSVTRMMYCDRFWFDETTGEECGNQERMILFVHEFSHLAGTQNAFGDNDRHGGFHVRADQSGRGCRQRTNYALFIMNPTGEPDCVDSLVGVKRRRARCAVCLRSERCARGATRPPPRARSQDGRSCQSSPLRFGAWIHVSCSSS